MTKNKLNLVDCKLGDILLNGHAPSPKVAITEISMGGITVHWYMDRAFKSGNGRMSHLGDGYEIDFHGKATKVPYCPISEEHHIVEITGENMFS